MPRPGISRCTFDRTKNCLTIELRKLLTRSNLGVFLLNFQESLLLCLSTGFQKIGVKICKKKITLRSQLKELSKVSMLCEETQFWTSFQKNFPSMNSEKGNRVLPGAGGGGGAQWCPPPWFLEHKKSLVRIGLSETYLSTVCCYKRLRWAFKSKDPPYLQFNHTLGKHWYAV